MEENQQQDDRDEDKLPSACLQETQAEGCAAAAAGQRVLVTQGSVRSPVSTNGKPDFKALWVKLSGLEGKLSHSTWMGMSEITPHTQSKNQTGGDTIPAQHNQC